MKTKRLGLRVLEALREIGVLLMAFGPLEAAVNTSKPAPALWANRAGYLFFVIGLGLFLLAVYWNGGLSMPPDLIVLLGAVVLTGAVGGVAAWRLLSHAQRLEAKRRADQPQLELSLRLERAEKEIEGVRKRLAGGAV